MMKTTIITLLPLLIFCNAFTQTCDEDALAKIGGKWKPGRVGSVENVVASNLAREKEMVAQLHKMITSAYNPTGGDIVFGGSYGYNKYAAKNWQSDPYEYHMYFLKYRCNRQAKDNQQKYSAENETPTSVYISVNKIWSQFGNFELLPGELPEDHPDGYLRITKWPEKRDGHYYWLIQEPGARDSRKEYQFLVTYENKLPFIPFTRKEYLDIKVQQLKDFLKELEVQLKEVDPDFDAASKRVYNNMVEAIQSQKALISQTETMLKNMSPAEQKSGAVIYSGEARGEFSGFKEDNEPNIVYLVKPNPRYFNQSLPKWVPQYFSIIFQLATDDPVYSQNIKQIEQAIDFRKLSAMLGKQ